MARADADRAAAAERDRQTLCHLLAGRCQQDTALIVAMSELRTGKVSDFDGGEYEVSFAVPPQAYDAANTESVMAELTAGAAALGGADHLRRICIELSRRGRARVVEGVRCRGARGDPPGERALENHRRRRAGALAPAATYDSVERWADRASPPSQRRRA